MSTSSRSSNAATIKFGDVQTILENAVNRDTIGKHGNFWRNKTRDQFVALQIMGQQLLVVGDSAASNLIKALKGLPPFDGTLAPQMPEGYSPVPDAQIQQIVSWIDAQCPA
ncbi:MAG: hypothetical protein ACJ8C4_15365 [Gemmataceae bacterium]